MAVFLSLGLVVLNMWFSAAKGGERGVLGGPTGIDFELPVPIVLAAAPLGGDVASNFEAVTPNVGVSATLGDPGRPMGIFGTRGTPINYVVKSGDTLSGIAAEFGITIQTITAANPSIRANSLRPGQELTILPVSGVVYQVHGGESLDSIAELFGVRPEQIQGANEGVNFGALEEGTSLVIPGGRLSAAANRRSTLPDLRGYFARPTQGFNWGRLHNYNAVDIANVCGTPITAAAEGLVVEAAKEGWNTGYGHMIRIEHPNETETLYAHLADVFVDVGGYVKQGEEIGTIGNTGNVHGPTGCHLHFEVKGAQNPFAK